MKNYELIAALMNYPAGYDVVLNKTITKKEMDGAEIMEICDTVVDIDVSEINEEIALVV